MPIYYNAAARKIYISDPNLQFKACPKSVYVGYWQKVVDLQFQSFLYCYYPNRLILWQRAVRVKNYSIQVSVDGLESGVLLSSANVLNQILFKLRVDLRLFIFRQPLF